jgi:hypothetical protein
MEIRKWKMEKKDLTLSSLRRDRQNPHATAACGTPTPDKIAATRWTGRASIFAKAEPRPVEDEVERPAAAFDC